MAVGAGRCANIGSVSRGDGERGLGIGDRLELRALVDAYALAADRKDAAWFRSLWLPDAKLTIHDGDGPARSTVEGEALGGVTVQLARYALSLHVVANHVCWADEGDDDRTATATGEAYCLAHHLTPIGGGAADDAGGEHDDYVMAIRYIDRYGRDGDGAWRFANRQVRRQWTAHEKVRARTGGPA
jgi:hypothetical protein